MWGHAPIHRLFGTKKGQLSVVIVQIRSELCVQSGTMMQHNAGGSAIEAGGRGESTKSCLPTSLNAHPAPIVSRARGGAGEARRRTQHAGILSSR